jgi:hypothetical protein
MKTKIVTVSEFAKHYGCSSSYVARKLRYKEPLEGIISYRKIEGRTTSWLIEVNENLF